MIKCDILIGIDPDVTKSGVAFLNRSSKALEMSSLSFPELLDYLKFVQNQSKKTDTPFKVVIEAGWLNKAHWHIRNSDNPRVASMKGNHTGRNHEVGRKIAEMCKHWQIPYELMKPLPKRWKGKDRKITHEEFNNELMRLKMPILPRSNQEERDACLLILAKMNL